MHPENAQKCIGAPTICVHLSALVCQCRLQTGSGYDGDTLSCNHSSCHPLLMMMLWSRQIHYFWTAVIHYGAMIEGDPLPSLCTTPLFIAIFSIFCNVLQFLRNHSIAKRCYINPKFSFLAMLLFFICFA